MDKLPSSLQERLARAEGSLARLVARASHRRTLLNQVRELLPEPVAGHCIGVEEHERTLILVMKSPAWATRARYLLPALEPRLRGLVSPAAEKISTRASRGTGTRSGKHRPTAARRSERLSSEARESIRTAARSISDPELRRALERLARET